MAMKLDRVVPFGRSLDEYRHMFDLTDADLRGRILGVGDGPASFNTELHACGIRVTSVDPLYTLDGDAIRSRFDACVDDIIAQVTASPDDWVWSYHRSPDDLRRNREQAITRFLEDYPAGAHEGRYVVGELPALPFEDRLFDLALCSHFLFLYSDRLSYDFHYASVREMLRIANEARIFPLLTLSRERSPHLAPLTCQLANDGFAVAVHPVRYELQKGGNEMLVVRRDG